MPSWYPSQVDPTAGTFFRDRAKILQRYGFKVVVITSLIHSHKMLYRSDHPPLISASQGREQGVLTYRQESINWFPKLPLLTHLFYQQRIISLFKRAVTTQGAPQMVFINSSLWAGAAMGRFLMQQGIPYVISEHLKEFLPPVRLTYLQRKCINRAYRYTHGIIATSTALKKAIAAQFPEARGKLTVIPNPAEVTAFEIHHSFPSPGLFRFVAIALFRPEKRLEILIRAFAQIADYQPGITLDLIGDGALRQDLKALAQELGISRQVSFCGYLSKTAVARKLAQMHCLVLSSEEETFGVALVEAMAAGLPVIATRCGGPQDIIRPETGMLVEPNNVKALAAAMIGMMENYAQYSPDQIRAVAEKHYSDRAFASAINQLFNKIKQTNRRPVATG